MSSGASIDETIALTNSPISPHAVRINTILEGSLKLPDKEEYEELQRTNYENGETKFQGKRQAGKGTNVDETVLPFDSNRVVLKNKVDGSDYQNASWMFSREEIGAYDLLRLFPYQPFDETNFIVSRMLEI